MRRYAIAAALMLLSAALHAQNLNPTVQVTNAFEGRRMEVEKNTLDMAVPDSLLKFDWDFGYSVFDNPYKGAYEFVPYLIEMRPEPRVYDGKKFYLRAGAGYSLHPEAQIAWTPTLKGRWGLTLYDDFKGFWGDWFDLSAVSLGDSRFRIHKGDGSKVYFGSDVTNTAGAAARYDAQKAVVTLDAKLHLLETDDSEALQNGAIGATTRLRVRSNTTGDLTYDASLRYDWTADNVGGGLLSTPFDYMEHDLGADANFGYAVTPNHGASLNASYDHVIFSDHGTLTSADVVSVNPGYDYSNGRFDAHVGVKYSQVWCQTPLTSTGEAVCDPDYKGRNLYPDVRVSYEAVKDALVVGASVAGGQKFNTYRSYLESNHHFASRFSEDYAAVYGDASVNTFDARLSLSGRVRSRFQYSLAGGYARWYNAPLESVYADGLSFFDYVSSNSAALSDRVFYLGYDMANFFQLYAQADASWHGDRIDASATLRYQHHNFTDVTYALCPARFLGSAALTYNFGKRLYIGVNAEWMTKRAYDADHCYRINESYSVETPGWVDLGCSVEYKLNRKLSLWAQGSNLLCQTIMRDVMFAQKGLYGTAGLTLNF